MLDVLNRVSFGRLPAAQVTLERAVQQSTGLELTLEAFWFASQVDMVKPLEVNTLDAKCCIFLSVALTLLNAFEHIDLHTTNHSASHLYSLSKS